MNRPPLILTLAIEKNAFSYFDALRQKHFPADRNFINAHLTLFHALPNSSTTITDVDDISIGEEPFVLQVTKPVSIGRGVAFKIESSQLMRIHKSLQTKWSHFLTAQDKQSLWPHITVQNKVLPVQAKDLLVELSKDFQPFSIQAQGLQLWEYLDGPWKLVRQYPFQALNNKHKY